MHQGLVTDQEAQELYHMSACTVQRHDNSLVDPYLHSFFSGCHLFIPLFDPAYDTYDGLKERTPFCFDAILTVASKIRSGNGQPQYSCAL